LKGNLFEKAAEKFSEAIDLAPSIPSASKDTLALYNNRSAMLERLERFDESLSDISVVISKDPLHLKGRARRARILENQGKLTESLEELVLIMTIEAHKQSTPTVAGKIDEINRKISGVQAEKHMAALRSSKGRDLPTKSYCRTFLDLFPSHYEYQEKLKSTSRISLAKELKSAESPAEKISATLNLTWKDIVDGNISDGLIALGNTLPTLVSVEGSEGLDLSVRMNLSKLYDLFGSSLYLRCNFADAVDALEMSLKFDDANFEAALKLASISLELGELLNAESRLNFLCDTQLGDNLAWCLVHRASLWSSRNESGEYRSNAISLALGDLEQALKLTGWCCHFSLFTYAFFFSFTLASAIMRLSV